MTDQARGSFEEATNPVKRKRQLASFLHISAREMDQLLKRLNELPRTLEVAMETHPRGYFGLMGGQPRRSLGGFHYVNPRQFLQGEPRNWGGFFYLTWTAVSGKFGIKKVRGTALRSRR
jgi:hypothetical protein